MKPVSSRSCCHSSREIQESAIVAAPEGPRTERVSVRALSSQSARSKMPGSRSSQRPWVSAMSSGLGAKTSKTSRPPGGKRGAGRGQGLDPLAVVREVKVGAERADDERHPLVERVGAQVAEPQVEQVGDALGLGAAAAGGEHLARGIDADHADALLRDRNRDPPGADSELDDGTAGPARLGDVEVDVLGDAAAPGVVELGNRVVGTGPATNLVHFRHRRVQFFAIRSNRRHAVPHPGG